MKRSPPASGSFEGPQVTFCHVAHVDHGEGDRGSAGSRPPSRQLIEHRPGGAAGPVEHGPEHGGRIDDRQRHARAVAVDEIPGRPLGDGLRFRVGANVDRDIGPVGLGEYVAAPSGSLP